MQSDGIFELESFDHQRGHVVGPEGMAKTRVLRAGVDLPGKAHLLDAPQPLEGPGLE